MRAPGIFTQFYSMAADFRIMICACEGRRINQKKKKKKLCIRKPGNHRVLVVKKVYCLALLFYIFPLTCCCLCQTQAWMDFDLILYGHSYVLINCSFSRNYFIPLQTDSTAFLLLHGQVNKPESYK